MIRRFFCFLFCGFLCLSGTEAVALEDADKELGKALSAYTKALREGNEKERSEAIGKIRYLGAKAAPAVPALVKALKVKDERERADLVEIIGDIGPGARGAVPALIAILEKDERSLVRKHAAWALGKIEDSKAIPSLTVALDDWNDDVQLHAAISLCSFGPKAKSALPAMVKVTKAKRAYSWLTLSMIGNIDTEGTTVPVLIDALDSPEPLARRFAASGLAQIGRNAKAAKEALAKMMKSETKDPLARMNAARAYWAVSGEADEAVKLLRTEFKSNKDPFLKRCAASALGDIGPAAKDAVPDLIAGLKDKSLQSKSELVEALREIGPAAKDAIPALNELLKDKFLHTEVALALWQIDRSDRSLPILIKKLKEEDADEFRYPCVEVIEAIAKLGPVAKEAVPLLRTFLDDRDASVRKAATDAIKTIEAK